MAPLGIGIAGKTTTRLGWRAKQGCTLFGPPCNTASQTTSSLSFDLSVYDGALWSLVGALSERSVATGNQRVDIPDVSGGRWNAFSEHPVFREV